MKEMLEALREASRQAIDEAVDMDALEALRVKYLGKKGELTALLKQMGKLSAEERPVIGQIANEVRESLTNAISEQHAKLAEKALELQLAAETLDHLRFDRAEIMLTDRLGHCVLVGAGIEVSAQITHVSAVRRGGDSQHIGVFEMLQHPLVGIRQAVMRLVHNDGRKVILRELLQAFFLA